MPHRTASAGFSPDRLSLSGAHPVIRFLLRSWLVWVFLFASLMLSGCVKSEVDINFESPNRGAIVQHIRLDERLTSFSSGTAKTWLDDIEKRVRRLQGNTRRLSNQEILVTIPFGNGEELETRFNEFFSPTNPSKTRSTQKELDLPKLDSHLDVQQGNFLLLQRHRLTYDLDLTIARRAGFRWQFAGESGFAARARVWANHTLGCAERYSSIKGHSDRNPPRRQTANLDSATRTKQSSRSRFLAP